MPRKMIVIASAGGEREDGTVNYSSYALVSSDTLKFDEPVFTDNYITRESLGGTVGGDGQTDDDDGYGNYVYSDDVIKHIESLGYTIESRGANILWLDRGE
jgi:hypothetical protein